MTRQRGLSTPASTSPPGRPEGELIPGRGGSMGKEQRYSYPAAETCPAPTTGEPGTARPGSPEAVAGRGIELAGEALHVLADGGDDSKALAQLARASHGEVLWAASYLLAALREAVAGHVDHDPRRLAHALRARAGRAAALNRRGRAVSSLASRVLLAQVDGDEKAFLRAVNEATRAEALEGIAYALRGIRNVIGARVGNDRARLSSAIRAGADAAAHDAQDTRALLSVQRDAERG